MSDIRYEFIMSQIKHIRDIKENEKTKISLVFYEGCQRTCVLKVCKNRDLLEVYNALMKVSHPNVAQVYDCVFENDNTYVLEEYIVGKTLAETLAETGTFSEKETTRIIMDVCDGLEVLHSQELPIIHNDIKSSNIMITEEGTAKLFDFDISRTYKEDSYKNTKLMGTYEYAAPEHYGFGQSDPRTDIYSLGVTMHEMLTGTGLDHKHNTTYQGSLINVIKKCVEIDPKKRYASAFALKNALKRNRILYSPILRIVLLSILIALLLGIMGHFLHGYIKDFIESAKLEEQYASETETVTEEKETIIGPGPIIETESETETPKDTEENNSVQNDTQQESEKEEIIPVKKKPEVVYTYEGEVCSMEAWDNGTYLWLEHTPYDYDQPTLYYIVASDGRRKLLESIDGGARFLFHSPSTDKMYMLTWGTGTKLNVYYIHQDLEIEFVQTIREEDGDLESPEEFFAFFSNGTVSYNGVLYNENDWSVLGDGVSCGTSIVGNPPGVFYSYVIKDRLYEVWPRAIDPLEGFRESDGVGGVLDRYLMKDMVYAGISSGNDNIYCDGEMAYFIGNKNGLSYLYGFDGETYREIACLNVLIPQYLRLCVTEHSVRFCLWEENSIYEFSLE